jgi:predicted CopG family antitoxin
METNSTILVGSNTRERLKKIGCKGQTYDDIINQLIDHKKMNVDSLHRGLENPKSSESHVTQQELSSLL